MRNLSDVLAETIASVEAREQAEAGARGMTVEQMHEADRLEALRAEREAVQRHEARTRRLWVERHRRFAPLPTVEAVYDRATRESEAVRHVRAFLASPKPALVLLGGVGCGKTVAALAAVRERPDAEMVKAAELARAIDPWKLEREAGWRPIDVEASLVVIDDLGTELEEPRFHQALFAILDSRGAADTKTIITANLEPRQIRERYLDRIADRLNAMARAVRIAGPSMREQGAGL
jgi:DNA replication protein DnaC